MLYRQTWFIQLIHKIYISRQSTSPIFTKHPVSSVLPSCPFNNILFQTTIPGFASSSTLSTVITHFPQSYPTSFSFYFRYFYLCCYTHYLSYSPPLLPNFLSISDLFLTHIWWYTFYIFLLSLDIYNTAYDNSCWIPNNFYKNFKSIYVIMIVISQQICYIIHISEKGDFCRYTITGRSIE